MRWKNGRKIEYLRCPKCGGILRPSKLEDNKWVCLKCNEVLTNEYLIRRGYKKKLAGMGS